MNKLFIIIIIILIICITHYNLYFMFDFFNNSNDESSNNNIAFCLLIRDPHIIWLDFLKKFKNYDIYIVIDNPGDYSNLKEEYSNITFVEIDDEECKNSNYVNSDYIFSKIVATDRAYYYFNKIKTTYDHIWFCEDDVFFFNENTLINIDNKYPSADLLVPQINFKDEDHDWPHWHAAGNKLELPHAHSLICLSRVSKNLMIKLDNFVIENKYLVYKEILFHTLCLNNDMQIETPSELKSITLYKDWTIDEINTVDCYHPIKNLEEHVFFRNVLM